MHRTAPLGMGMIEPLLIMRDQMIPPVVMLMPKTTVLIAAMSAA